MPTLIEEDAVVLKTRELCQAILDRPDVRAMRARIDAFMADDKARSQYDALMVKGQMLHQKQHAGQPLEDKEIKEFESLREGFLKNPVGNDFVEAQEDMQRLQKSVTQYVTKTFELGRVPEASDLESGCCGDHGCGCSH